MLWVWRVADAAIGMRTISDIASPAWDRPAPANAPRVSIIVPARDEEAQVESGLRSLTQLDWPNYEVIAINDRSTDRTPEIMEHVARDHDPRRVLKILHVDSLPNGWLGKPHAMWTAAQQATGDYLLFTDADIVFHPESLRRAMAYALHSNADHLVVFPTHVDWSVSKKIMLAGFNMLFVFGHRPWKTADPNSRDHIGVGAFNLVKRSAYEKVGTFAALKMEIIEDMRLGKLIKDHGLAQRNVLGKDLLLLPWGSGALHIINNLTKNFFALMHFSVKRALAACFLLLFFNITPFVGVWLAHGWAKLPFVVSLASILCLYIGMSWNTPIWPQYFFLHPLSTGMLIYTMMVSMIRTLRQDGVIWRGTHYSLADLRRGLVKG
ncbi:MAG TPA: glycosyltransferase [Terriglobales bacterium]|nr:glycosyltransferase [Terriglobales bacterium]